MEKAFSSLNNQLLAAIFLWKKLVSLTDDILEVIWKLQKPSLYASEIRVERLLRKGICTRTNVPTSSDKQQVGNDLEETYQYPSEYMTPKYLAKVDDYLNITSGLNIFLTKDLLLSLPAIACLGSSYRVQPAIDRSSKVFKDMLWAFCLDKVVFTQQIKRKACPLLSILIFKEYPPFSISSVVSAQNLQLSSFILRNMILIFQSCGEGMSIKFIYKMFI